MLGVIEKQERFAEEDLFTLPPWDVMLVPILVDIEFVPVEADTFINQAKDIHTSNVYYGNTHRKGLFVTACLLPVGLILFLDSAQNNKNEFAKRA